MDHVENHCTTVYARSGQTAVVLYFLLLLQSVGILQNGIVVASVPHNVIFASRSKKNYNVTEA